MGFKHVCSQTDSQVFLFSAIISFVIVSVGAWLFFRYFELTSTEAAAWMQAVGSLIAVWSAVYVFGLGEKAKKVKEKKEAEIDFLMDQFDLWSLYNAIYALKWAIDMSLGESEAENVNSKVLGFYKTDAKINLDSILNISGRLNWRSFIIHDESLKSAVGNIIKSSKILYVLKSNLQNPHDYYFNSKDLTAVAKILGDVSTLVGHVDRSLES
ncbi:hypothetical protein ACI0FN_00527 [Alcaligenes nematophilus]|uniref:hypothetical protein n=1 Tax=Alcaligenes nematophilus TaxID=2994643 RepID=UPI00384C9B45